MPAHLGPVQLSPVSSRTRSRTSQSPSPAPDPSPPQNQHPHASNINTPTRRARASSVPSSPLEQLYTRRNTEGPPAPRPPAGHRAIDPKNQELLQLLQQIGTIVSEALPSEQLSQKWRPLTRANLEKVRASAERGIALLAGAAPMPEKTTPPQPQPAPQAEAGNIAALAATTAKMQDELRALKEVVLASPLYAQVAQAGTAATTPTHPKPTVSRIIPPPAHPGKRLPIIRKQHRVVLNTQALDPQHPARKDSEDALLGAVRWPISLAIRAKPISVNRLRSGDLAINLATAQEVDQLLQANSSWISSAFPGRSDLPTTRAPDFCSTRSLVLHGVPFEVGAEEQLRVELFVNNGTKITKSKWLTSETARKAGGRSHGSVIISFEREEDRERVLKRGSMGCKNRSLFVAEYRPRQRLQQCSNCQQYGHVKRHCTKKPRCRLCARKHTTSEHPACDACTARPDHDEADGCQHDQRQGSASH
ncbi:hypothetical protein OC844_007932 [Tilletia horrida]|nr:hypothetical protein OC844_007932 [Tilletia horrida]